MNEHYEKWDQMAPRGMLLVGFGLSMIGRATILRANKRGFLRWFVIGTIGLALFNAGIAYFGESVKHRTLYELEVQKLREK